MKTNPRRKNPPSGGHNYSYLNYVARRKVGLSSDHDGGHKGSAKDIREAKTNDRRIKRRQANNQVRKELDVATSVY